MYLPLILRRREAPSRRMAASPYVVAILRDAAKGPLLKDEVRNRFSRSEEAAGARVSKDEALLL